MDAEPTEPRRASDLTYEQGLALALVTVRGLSYREAAERMGRAPADVLQLLRDALRELRRALPDRAAT